MFTVRSQRQTGRLHFDSAGPAHSSGQSSREDLSTQLASLAHTDGGVGMCPSPAAVTQSSSNNGPNTSAPFSSEGRPLKDKEAILRPLRNAGTLGLSATYLFTGQANQALPYVTRNGTSASKFQPIQTSSHTRPRALGPDTLLATPRFFTYARCQLQLGQKLVTPFPWSRMCTTLLVKPVSESQQSGACSVCQDTRPPRLHNARAPSVTPPASRSVTTSCILSRASSNPYRGTTTC